MRFCLDESVATPGLIEGVRRLRVGEKAVVTCCPHMAYGEAGMPPFVKSNSYIVYFVEVISCDGDCAEPSGPPELLIRPSVSNRDDMYEGRESTVVISPEYEEFSGMLSKAGAEMGISSG